MQAKVLVEKNRKRSRLMDRDRKVEQLREAYRSGEMSREDVDRELRGRSRVMGRNWGIMMFCIMVPWQLWQMFRTQGFTGMVMLLAALQAVIWWLGGWLFGRAMYWYMRRVVMK